MATLWSLAIRGFEGGRWSDTPIIKSFVDPRLYQRDPFIWTLHEGTPAAFSYQLIALVARALSFLSLDQVLLVIYLPLTVVTLTLLWRLARTLGAERDSAVLFLILYVAGFRLLTIGSPILHSAETTPQTLALPLQLGSMLALLGRRLSLAGTLMGLACLLHVPSTVYLAGAMIFYELLSLRGLGAPAVARSLALFTLTASPAVVGSLLQHGDQLPGWAINLARAELATDISIAVHFSNRAFVTYNLIGAALLFLAARSAPEIAARRLVALFSTAVLLMWTAAFLLFDLWPSSPFTTLVARLQLPRASWIVIVFGLLALSSHLTRSWQTRGGTRAAVLLIVAAMLAATAEFTPLDPLYILSALLLLFVGLVAQPAAMTLARWAPLLIAAGCLAAGAARVELREYDFELSVRSGLTFAGLALAWALSFLLTRAGWSAGRATVPAILIGLLVAAAVQRGDEWQYQRAHRGGLASAAEFQEWVRTSTPVDSVFLLLPGDPNNNTFYERAERAVFLVRERANQAVYFREHSFEFERRVKALGIEQPLRYREELDPAYRRLTEEQVRRLASEFGVTHFVPARAGSFSFPIVYQQGAWTVYEVR